MTEAGRAELVRWLESPAERLELRDENLLKLFFSDALPLASALEHLRLRRLGHEQVLTFLRGLADEPGDDPPFVDLVLRYGIAYTEFNVAWCREQEARLAEGAVDARRGASVGSWPSSS